MKLTGYAWPAAGICGRAHAKARRLIGLMAPFSGPAFFVASVFVFTGFLLITLTFLEPDELTDGHFLPARVTSVAHRDMATRPRSPSPDSGNARTNRDRAPAK